MKTTLIALFGLFAAAVMATNVNVCPNSLNSTPLCCDTDILGIADLNCNSRTFLQSRHYQLPNIDAINTMGEETGIC
jgi:hypothetical protein